MHGAHNTCECMYALRKNAYGLVHARLCNSAEASLPWKLLQTCLQSCASIVQAVVWRQLLPPLLLPRINPSPDAVRSWNLSKSTLAHDAVAAAVSTSITLGLLRDRSLGLRCTATFPLIFLQLCKGPLWSCAEALWSCALWIWIRVGTVKLRLLTVREQFWGLLGRKRGGVRGIGVLALELLNLVDCLKQFRNESTLAQLVRAMDC